MRQFHGNRNRDARRTRLSMLFAWLCLFVSSVAVVVLLTLLVTIFIDGAGSLNWGFLTGVHVENQPEKSGIWQALIGSIAVCSICGVVALPIGIGTAIYLEEFKPRHGWMRKFQSLVQLNINNLAGVPSIVYGILGVTTFVYMFGIFGRIEVNQRPPIEIGASYFYQLKTVSSLSRGIPGRIVTFPAEDPSIDRVEVTRPIEVSDAQGNQFQLNVLSADEPLPTDPDLLDRSVRRGTVATRFKKARPYYFHIPFGKSFLAAGLTLALVILPIVIIAAQEALRAVSASLREAALGLGATRWQVVRGVVLPSAMPGIMTGAILAMSRAVGEAAPLIAVMGGVLGTTRGLVSLMSTTPVLPVTIYKWAGHQNRGYGHLSAAAIIILLVFLLLVNSIAIWIRHKAERKLGA